MDCQHCGAKISEQAKFCSECGRAVGETASAQAAESKPVSSAAAASGSGAASSVLGMVAGTDLKTLAMAMQIAAIAIVLMGLLAASMGSWLGFALAVVVASGFEGIKKSLDNEDYAKVRQYSPWLAGACFFFGLVASQAPGGGVVALVDFAAGAIAIWAFLRVKDLG